jgi:RNA polymerase sigma factor (sigma-70 family)
VSTREHSEIENVFAEGYAGDPGDAALVARAQQGEKEALETLIGKHQQWIYNIVLRMVGSPEDAEDVSQEILIKVITKLSTFEKRSAFRTWLYSIVVNHVLTTRRRPWERMFSSFDRQGELIESLELSHPAPRGQDPVEELLVWETRSGCMTGMLLCLDRAQRMALVLSTFFGVDSALGGELLETTPENYRQILSRGRRQLGNFMNDKCGLMNEANPCRCARKTQAAIRTGLVDPDRPRFDLRYLHRIREFVAEKEHLVDTPLDRKLQGLLREQPLYESPDLKRVLAVALRRGELGEIINFS